jgi:hypothetical protein
VGNLLKLALTALAASSQASALKVFTGRMIAALVLVGLALVMAGAAWGCICAAVWIGLTPSLGPVGAPLIVAALCIVVGGILALVAWTLARRRRPVRPHAELQVEALLSEAGKVIKEHKGAALILAALLGIMVGNGGRRS